MAIDSPRVLIIGCSGQLGRSLVRLIDQRAIVCNRNDLDLLRLDLIAPAIAHYAPDVVINCAAYTFVDKAEEEWELCRAINVEAVRALAHACEASHCLFVQISSDYVFGGLPLGRPWRESDNAEPLGIYAQSKLDGEEAARRCARHIVVRTCGLYGGGPQRKSFVEQMLHLAKHHQHLRIVDDQHCTPSLVHDVAQAIQGMINRDACGTYHIVNRGATTWFRFAREVFRLAEIDVELEPISTIEFNARAPRPAYSVLDTTKYESHFGAALRAWELALADYLLVLRPLIDD